MFAAATLIASFLTRPSCLESCIVSWTSSILERLAGARLAGGEEDALFAESNCMEVTLSSSSPRPAKRSPDGTAVRCEKTARCTRTVCRLKNPFWTACRYKAHTPVGMCVQ